MKKSVITLSIVAMCVVTYFGQAQTNDDPRHENHYKKIAPVQTDELTIEFSNAHSQADFTLVKAKITNKTSDYIFFEPSEVVFKYEHGEFSPKSGIVKIKPKGSKSKTLKVTGDNRFHVESLSIALKGFYRISVKGKVQEAPDFRLPAEQNTFTAGNFECNLLKVSQETQKTAAQFQYTYNGDKVGIVDPSKLVVRIENGTEYANANRKSKINLLEPGDSKKFTAWFLIPGKILDMQFATMYIVWKDTFIESSKIPISTPSVNFVLDPGLTEGKNN